MKALLLISVLFILNSATASTTSDAQAKVLQHKNTNDGSGNYKFSFETSNGLQRSESGTVVNKGQADEHILVEGQYSYIDPAGNMVVVNYSSDQNKNEIKTYIIQADSDSLIDVRLNFNVVATLIG